MAEEVSPSLKAFLSPCSLCGSPRSSCCGTASSSSGSKGVSSPLMSVWCRPVPTGWVRGYVWWGYCTHGLGTGLCLVSPCTHGLGTGLCLVGLLYSRAGYGAMSGVALYSRAGYGAMSGGVTVLTGWVRGCVWWGYCTHGLGTGLCLVGLLCAEVVLRMQHTGLVS